MKISSVMTRAVVTIGPQDGVKDAAGLLVANAISALPVVDEGGALVGIVSEADLISMETRPDPRSQATPLEPTAGSAPVHVSDVMTRNVITVQSDDEVAHAARVMIESDIKRVPVMHGGRLVGILSRRDLVKVIARRDEDLEVELETRLREAGINLPAGAVTVTGGVASIGTEAQTHAGRLAESVALGVPGVLEVRFGA
ncbi:MAG TPA: CBS domain-containing protein [Candidatus Dormibacteraeota bacterium]|nr:CBS domain-containing protein [Candidatus Dormibacteraeota bacterium]